MTCAILPPSMYQISALLNLYLVHLFSLFLLEREIIEYLQMLFYDGRWLDEDESRKRKLEEDICYVAVKSFYQYSPQLCHRITTFQTPNRDRELPKWKDRISINSNIRLGVRSNIVQSGKFYLKLYICIFKNV